MRRITALLALLALLLTLLPASTLAAPRDAAAREAVIVVFHDSVASPVAAAEDLGRRHGFGAQFVYQHALKGFAASVPSGALNALARDPRVAWIEADQAVHAYADPDVPTGIERIFADDNAEITIDGTDDQRIDVDVAIIDTGIDLDHPDLNVKVADSVNCLNSSSGGPPWARTYTCSSGGDDDNEHGTHVAGTVGALDNGVNFNGVDVVGVAPGARLWAVKVLDANGSGSLGAVTAGIDYVTENADQIEVANMSLGCECVSAAMDTAIATSVKAGVTYAVAAGNSNADASTHSPANHPDVITVSALADFDGLPGALGSPTCRTDQDDTLADFSNFGDDIEIAAPGVCILSTVPGGGYDGTFSGTSMASPHVAGAAALLAASANYTPLQIEGILVAEGNDGWTDDSGDDIPEPLLDVSDAAIFNPATVAGSDPDGTEPPPDDNTAPSADDVSATTNEDVAISIDLSGSDAETCDLTFSIVSGPTNGSLGSIANLACTSGTPNADTATVTYTPNLNYNGGDSFTYRVSDGSATDDGIVSVTINSLNDPPVAVNDTYSTPTNEELTVEAPGVLTNDTDVDGDTLSATKLTDPGNGTVTVSANGSFTYTPETDFTGTDSFTYTVSDPSGASDTGTVSITVGSLITVESLTDLGSMNNGSTWTARVRVTITDSSGNPVEGATVDGSWTYNGTTTPDGCNTTTNASGQCDIELSGIRKNFSSAKITITSVTHSQTWDGVEKSLTVFKP